jgi:hypothetical protein
MTGTVAVLAPKEAVEWRRTVSMHLTLSDARLRLAEEHADPAPGGLSERFRQLAVAGLAVESAYHGKFLPRPVHAGAARARLGLPAQRFRVLLPPQLYADFRAARSPAGRYAARFLRLIEIGLLHEQSSRDSHSLTAAHPALAGAAVPALALSREPRSPQEAAATVIANLHAALEAPW